MLYHHYFYLMTSQFLSGLENRKVITVELNDMRFTLCNLYAPNNDCPDFLLQHLNWLNSFSKIIAGDFNLVMDIHLDKKGGREVTHFKSREALEVYMQEGEIVDIWRLYNPSIQKFTWERKKPKPIFCRLDMFFDMVGLTDSVNLSLWQWLDSDSTIQKNVDSDSGSDSSCQQKVDSGFDSNSSQSRNGVYSRLDSNSGVRITHFCL